MGFVFEIVGFVDLLQDGLLAFSQRADELGGLLFGHLAGRKSGEDGIVDMIGLSGWYTIVSMTLNVDRYPLGAGLQPELKPLENPLPPPVMLGAGFATPIPGTPSPSSITTNIKGKAMFIWWSYAYWGLDEWDGIRWDRIGNFVH